MKVPARGGRWSQGPRSLGDSSVGVCQGPDTRATRVNLSLTISTQLPRRRPVGASSDLCFLPKLGAAVSTVSPVLLLCGNGIPPGSRLCSTPVHQSITL